ncbi:MAG: urease accessory protein [Gemmatimonadetes bacterium]|nr:urease accessory protein [Gemmatimonadota bacterium]
MVSILLAGLVMGMRHALEADHLAAVASLAVRTSGVRGSVARGVAWGVGHTLTLFVVGGSCLLLGATVPDDVAVALERGVGLMLLVLGGDVVWRVRRQGVHLHVDAHPGVFPRRALLVGLVHGTAGSAALLLLAVASAASGWRGLLYIALFGAGSIFGMALLSAVIAIPMRTSARAGNMYVGFQALLGLGTASMGVWMLAQGR